MNASKCRPFSAAAATLDADPAVGFLGAKLARLERRLAARDRQFDEALARLRSNIPKAETASPAGQSSSPAAAQRADYRSMIARICGLVERVIPGGATVMVVSRGDDELLKLGARKGWHFPQNGEGLYAGHHPANSPEAIRQLEELRARGGEFLVFPATAFWWLEHYGDFQRHLQSRYALTAREDQTAQIFDVRARQTPARGAMGGTDANRYAILVKQLRRMVEGLLPADAKVAVISRGDSALLQLGSRQAWHVPADASGRYAGHHPADGTAALAQIRATRARGAQFLVIPSTAFWWLDFYQELARHLRQQCRLVQHQPHVGTIFEL